MYQVNALWLAMKTIKTSDIDGPLLLIFQIVYLPYACNLWMYLQIVYMPKDVINWIETPLLVFELRVFVSFVQLTPPPPISSSVTMSLNIIPVVCILKVLVLLNNKRFVVHNTYISSFWQGNHFEKKNHHELFPSFCAVHQVQLLKKGMKKITKIFS